MAEATFHSTNTKIVKYIIAFIGHSVRFGLSANVAITLLLVNVSYCQSCFSITRSDTTVYQVTIVCNFHHD